MREIHTELQPERANDKTDAHMHERDISRKKELANYITKEIPTGIENEETTYINKERKPRRTN